MMIIYNTIVRLVMKLKVLIQVYIVEFLLLKDTFFVYFVKIVMGDYLNQYSKSL
jgi:hypothetical protein